MTREEWQKLGENLDKRENSIRADYTLEAESESDDELAQRRAQAACIVHMHNHDELPSGPSWVCTCHLGATYRNPA